MDESSSECCAVPLWLGLPTVYAAGPTPPAVVSGWPIPQPMGDWLYIRVVTPSDTSGLLGGHVWCTMRY